MTVSRITISGRTLHRLRRAWRHGAPLLWANRRGCSTLHEREHSDDPGGRSGARSPKGGKNSDTAAADGRSATAGNYYLRAGTYYYTAERMVPPGEKKVSTYRKSLRARTKDSSGATPT